MRCIQYSRDEPWQIVETDAGFRQQMLKPQDFLTGRVSANGSGSLALSAATLTATDPAAAGSASFGTLRLHPQPVVLCSLAASNPLPEGRH